MEKISPDIFRMYDIRGIYGQDLTDNTALLIGKALGTFFQEKGQKRIIVGRDNRISGKALLENLTNGLLATGCEVVDLGVIIAPIVYFSWFKIDAQATAFVTASHNPAQYNGFKCSLNKKPLVGENYQKIKRICLEEKFKSGSGLRTKIDLWPAYKEKIISSVKLTKKLKIALDCGNGTASLFAPELLREMGVEIIPLYCDSDGSFPNHQPYPQKTEFYTELINTIKEKKCDLGLSFDGDGDRLGIYDETGNFVENDRLAMIFGQDICEKTKNPKIVMNVSTSLSVIDFIHKAGGEVILWKTGYPYISEKMKQTGALFGAEISGHFFFADRFFGFDDALYAAVRALEIFDKRKESVSQIINALPKYFETREFRVEIPKNANKQILVEKIKKDLVQRYPDLKIIDLDGIRFSFPTGWGLIRSSNTEPLLTGRAEAKDEETLSKIKEIIRKELLENKISLNWEEAA